jgi:hypothetical protein
MSWPDRVVGEDGRILLVALHSYFNLLQMLESMYLSDSDWDVRLYTLIDDDTPIGTCDPCRVWVRHYPTAPLERHRFRKKRAPKRKDPLLDALDHVGDDDSDGSHHSDDDSGPNEPSDDGDGSTSGADGRKDDPPVWLVLQL